MKMGVAISISILIAIIIVIIVSMRGIPQKSTNLTNDFMLEKQMPDLPSGMYSESGGDASGALEELWAYYDDNDHLFGGDDATVELKEKCMDLYIRVYEAGSLNGKFLDKTCPIEVRAAPTFGPSMGEIARLAMLRVHELYQKDLQPDRCKKAATACYAVGHQMFSKAKRLPIRVYGFQLMKVGMTELYNQSVDGSQDSADFTQTYKELNKFSEQYFTKKNNFVYELKPNVGDLLNMCYDDKDVSFRIEATLTLAVVKWNPRSRGNATAVANAIEKLQNDSNSMVAKAAKAAAAFTKDDLHQIGS